MSRFITNTRGGDPVAKWRAAIDEVEREMKCDRFRAATIAARRHPDVARAARDACRH